MSSKAISDKFNKELKEMNRRLTVLQDGREQELETGENDENL